MAWGILRKLDHVIEIEALADRLQPASKRGLTHCVQCGWCCARRTCVPSPEELIKIADYLKITVKELLHKYYVIDRSTIDNIGLVYHPRPANQSQTDLVGKFLPAERTYDVDKCIFQDDQYRCIIYPVRPKQAHQSECWNQSEERNKEIDKLNEPMFLAWKNGSLLMDNGFDAVKMDKESNNHYSWDDDEEEE